MKQIVNILLLLAAVQSAAAMEQPSDTERFNSDVKSVIQGWHNAQNIHCLQMFGAERANWRNALGDFFTEQLDIVCCNAWVRIYQSNRYCSGAVLQACRQAAQEWQHEGPIHARADKLVIQIESCYRQVLARGPGGGEPR